jgi:RHS repeat-associated protein
MTNINLFIDVTHWVELFSVKKIMQSGLVNNFSFSFSFSYKYDPFGRRIFKSISNNENKEATYFSYNEAGLVSEMDLDGNKRVIYGFSPNALASGSWSTDPVWQVQASREVNSKNAKYNYLHTNNLGTPQIATDANGDVSWRIETEAFGLLRYINSELNINLRMPGQYFDIESSNYYNCNRFYNPAIGRYDQAGPIGLEGVIYIFTQNKIQ